MVSLATGVVPPKWRAEYSTSTEITIGAWVADLAARTKALGRYKPLLCSRGQAAGEKEEQVMRYWMGGMFAPHSFITATRQHSAQVGNSFSVSVLFRRLYYSMQFLVF